MTENIRLALDALTANKLRSILTIAGIFVAVTTIIIILTCIESLNNYVESEFSEIGSSTIYINKFPWVITDNFFEYRNRPAIKLREYEALKERNTYTRYVSPLAVYQRQLSYRNEVIDAVSIIGSNRHYAEIGNISAEFGRWFTEHEVNSRRYVCVLGASVVEALFGDGESVGKRIKIDGFPYRVIGVLERRGTSFGFDQDRQVIVPYTAMRNFAYSWRGIQVAMLAEDPNLTDAMKEEARGILRTVRKVPPGDKDNFAINQQDMLLDFYKQATGGLYLVLLVIAGVSLLVGGIGIMNIMLVSVTERTKEIGIRKAVGATRKSILRQILSETLLISSIGGILGMIAGVLVGWVILNWAFSLSAQVTPSIVLVGYGFSAMVGLVSGMYPAYRAANLHPIDALRYE